MRKQAIEVEVRDVIKDYGAEGEEAALRVLHGVSLSIEKGEFVAIMGASGSGKSTLLHLIGCLDKPTQGSVFIEGVNASRLGSDELAELRAKKIGFVFQAFNLLSNLTALQNVELAMAVAEKDKKTRRERATELLKQVGLEKRAGHKPSEMSGGEKQRVAVARAFANKPPLLLLDEPTGNLDSKSGEEVMGLIQNLWRKEGVTCVMVTHERSIAELAQRIIRVKDGAIQEIEKTVVKKGDSNARKK